MGTVESVEEPQRIRPVGMYSANVLPAPGNPTRTNRKAARNTEKISGDKANFKTVVVTTNSKGKQDFVECVPEDDGYRWRKYGRKMVKGNQFPRSYYKCTHQSCLVKKQVETIISEEGKPEIHTTYKGEHNHEPPQAARVNAQVSVPPVTVSSPPKIELPLPGIGVAGILSNTPLDQATARLNSNPIMPLSELKRNLKTPKTTSTATSGTKMRAKTTTKTVPRLIVETDANVDYLDDGFNWRKYGQKNVKGSPYPRSYYKCTEKGCVVKKQVEQSGNTMMNTYEGTHNHPPPTGQKNQRKRRRRHVASPPVTTSLHPPAKKRRT